MKNWRLASFAPDIRVADVVYNADGIAATIDMAEEQAADLLFLPELCVTSRSCGDLYLNRGLLDTALASVMELASRTNGKRLIAVFSAPVQLEDAVYETSFFAGGGQILAAVPRTDFSGETELLRWFRPWAGENGIYRLSDGSEVYVCTDLQIDGSSIRVAYGMTDMAKGDNEDITLVYTSSREAIGRISAIRKELADFTRKTKKAAIAVTPDVSESTGSGVCSGYSSCYRSGKHIGSVPPFERGLLLADTSSDPVPDVLEPDKCALALEIQGHGLAQRLKKIWVQKVILGISGGLDSTQALMAGVHAMDILGYPRTNLIAVTMPCFGTTSRTKSNAQKMSELCGVTFREISIRASVEQHLKDIGHDGQTPDVTYENAQARERTQVLMDLANMENAIVLGTGDMSEAALGWCTFNGDHISMYNVNCNLTKSFLREIVRYEANELVSGELSRVLLDVIDTPVSPELKPAVDGAIAQKTEDILGPYEVLDTFLASFVRDRFSVTEVLENALKEFKGRYSEEDIRNWLKQFVKRFFNNQFKRNCVPDGPAVIDYSISPFGGWIMTSDTSSATFLSELN